MLYPKIKLALHAAIFATLLPLATARADSHTTGVPVLNSKPGAAYTIFLDFSGFNYTGTWSGRTPGVNTSYDGTSNTAAFSVADQNTIKDYWARLSNYYSNFNVNITTVDPAVAAGQADTDAHRQAYYDTQARMTHTVVTTSYSWYGSAGGVSFIGQAPYAEIPGGFNSGAGLGLHTNWVFTQGSGTGHDGGAAAAHEDGHTLGLNHQSDYATNKVDEYSYGNSNGGNGSYAPIMGAGYYVQRAARRMGNVSSSAAIQNDPQILANDPGMGGYVEDNISHNIAAPSLLPLNGSTANSALAHGIISPASVSSPTPIGIDNYTKDYWAIKSDGVHPISLTVWDGDELLTSGVQDPDPDLRSKLNILSTSGALLATATEAANTLSENYAGLLPAGLYYAQITSFGGETQTLPDPSGGTFNTTYYYDMGSYFITGSGLVLAPEPTSLALLTLGALTLLRRRK